MANQSREHEMEHQDTLASNGVGTYAASVRTGEEWDTPITRAPLADRIRWGAVLAGLFAALTTLVVLSVLGLAIGLSSYNAGDPLSNFGLGAGIWGIITAVLAFLIGGWLAANTAGVRGRGNGLLNGAMVWVVAIPLLLSLLGSGLGSLVNTAGSVAATSVAAVAPVAAAAAPAASTAAAQTPGAAATVQTAGQDAAQAVQATVSAVGAQVNPQNVEKVTSAAGKTAWGTLVALLVGLLAAALGGLFGARTRPDLRQPLVRHSQPREVGVSGVA